MGIRLRYNENQKAADQIAAFLANVSERLLFHIPLYEIGKTFEIRYEDVLNIFIQGVYDGVFILEWIYHCPVCGNVAYEAPSLHQASSRNFCTACHKFFTNMLDDNIEACFSIHPRLRTLDPVFKTQYIADIGKNILNGKYRAWENPHIVRGVDIVQNNLYRELMSSEVLIGDQSLQLTNATVLFADIQDPSKFYSECGDIKAFALVKSYIKILSNTIKNFYGVPVKTMGDAVMGVFIDPAKAFDAAVNAQQQLIRRNKTKPKANKLEMKIGLHIGPMLVVTLNKRLDYFGLTVNTAAHIQDTALANEIVISKELFDNKHIKRLILSVTDTVQKQQIRFNGNPNDYTLYHIKIRNN